MMLKVDPPVIQWIGSHPNNFRAGRNGLALEAIVLHIAEGTMAGVDAWFKDPRARATTHFAVSKTGDVHQYVALASAAYGHGAIEEGYTAKLIDENRRPDGTPHSPNDWACGIEHEGKSGDVVPPAQFRASTQLAAWLFVTHLFTSGASGVAIDRDHVLKHADISPRSRPRCPGFSEVFMQDYIKTVRRLVHGLVDPPVLSDREALIAELRGMQAAAGDDALRAAVRLDYAMKRLQELGVT